ncbi:serine protease [Marinicrinis lubricantis]|uniref:Serine protease n=1 Tax=Marinicrinis lubricantis TaxID=2086470 RepID=A0ABW1IS03_9BACL
MSYFIISQDERFVHAVEPDGISRAVPRELLTLERIGEMDDWVLQFPIKEQQRLQGGLFVDFIQHPVTLWSDRLKSLLVRCSKKLKFQPVVLTDLKRLRQEPYWLMAAPEVHCLSNESEFHKDGSLKRPVIDERMAGLQPMMKVGGIREDLFIVSLGVAESILRRDFIGVRLTRIEGIYEENGGIA